MAAMAAFTFSSCEDVPAPYNSPSQPGTPDTPELTTDGSEQNPYTVTDAKQAGTGSDKFVKGYIVGFIPDKSLSEAVFSADNAVEVNVIIAASADETDVNKCMPVQLPSGDIRSAVNLKSNPSNLKKEVLLCGSIETYFGAVGLKSTCYAKIGDKEYGKKPGDTTPDTPAGEAKGDGTEANPFNSVAAQNLAKSLEADQATEKEYYIKGKIQKIADNGEFNTTYGNASFYIADDETSTQFYVFRTLYFGGKKWKEGDTQIKVGDEVVVCAKLINYKGNTPETNQGGKLISLNGKTAEETKPDTESGIQMTLTNIESGKTGDVELKTASYGKQDMNNPETWYTWKYDNIEYKGYKVCKAKDNYAGCLQVQGNASEQDKMGLVYNNTAYSKDIKTITLVVKGGSSYTTPTTFAVYGGSEATSTSNTIEGKYTMEAGEKVNTFTMTYDFSSESCKYFTIFNNATGALYIEKIIITLK